MKSTEKELIITNLNKLVERLGSQNKAANFLNVSSATVSQIINGKHELIRDEMFMKVKNNLNAHNLKHQIAETHNKQKIDFFLKDAKEFKSVHGIIAPEGSGKTQSAETFTENNKNTYHIKCSEYWNRKYFVQQLLLAMGEDPEGLTTPALMDKIIRVLLVKQDPTIIIDEIDKLSDPVLYFFITLYNLLEDKCGIVTLATPYFKKRLENGVRTNKKGYREIYSRLGKKLIELPEPTSTCMTQILLINGIDSRKNIQDIIKDSQSDLRRVKKKISANNRKKAA